MPNMLLVLDIFVVVLADHGEQLWLRLAHVVLKSKVLTVLKQPVDDESDVSYV